MKNIITWEVAEGMMNMAAYMLTIREYNRTKEEPDAEWVTRMAREWFLSYCNANNIEEIKEPEQGFNFM